jgi:hypothetical protein
MRDITRKAIAAFNESRPFNSSNTKVEVTPNCTILKLHNNAIAYRFNDPERTLSITNCGWQSDTTKERLNGIDGVRISQSKGKWYLNGNEWDGKIIEIK